jgi:hypothetical protein
MSEEAGREGREGGGSERREFRLRRPECYGGSAFVCFGCDVIDNAESPGNHSSQERGGLPSDQ